MNKRMTKIRNIGFLAATTFVCFTHFASGEDVNFEDFTMIKSHAILAGNLAGKLRACEAAYPSRKYGSKDFIDTYRKIISKADLSFEFSEKIDNFVTESAINTESSRLWIDEYMNMPAVVHGDCTDVCCSVLHDLNVYNSVFSVNIYGPVDDMTKDKALEALKNWPW